MQQSRCAVRLTVTLLRSLRLYTLHTLLTPLYHGLAYTLMNMCAATDCRSEFTGPFKTEGIQSFIIAGWVLVALAVLYYFVARSAELKLLKQVSQCCTNTLKLWYAFTSVCRRL
jgi:hypothetical protein